MFLGEGFSFFPLASDLAFAEEWFWGVLVEINGKKK